MTLDKAIQKLVDKYRTRAIITIEEVEAMPEYQKELSELKDKYDKLH